MPLITDCKAGWQKAYQRVAMYESQPFATAQAGAFRFFQNMAQTTAAWFGFVGFSAAPTNITIPGYAGNNDTADSCTYLDSGGFPLRPFLSLR